MNKVNENHYKVEKNQFFTISKDEKKNFFFVKKVT